MLNHSLTTNISDKSIHSLGGTSRAKKYEALKGEVFKKWKIGRFHSYAECAREYAVKYGLSTKTVESWLSKEFSKAKEA